MAKIADHFSPLPADLAPLQPSNETAKMWLERANAHGTPNKVIGIDLAVGSNNLSMWKAGDSLLPLSQILPLAKATDASGLERKRLLFDRLIELHGKKVELCLEAIVQFAVDWSELHGDEATLLGLLRTVVRNDESDPTYSLDGLLDDLAARARVRQVLVEIRNDYLGGLTAK